MIIKTVPNLFDYKYLLVHKTLFLYYITIVNGSHWTV